MSLPSQPAAILRSIGSYLEPLDVLATDRTSTRTHQGIQEGYANELRDQHLYWDYLYDDLLTDNYAANQELLAAQGVTELRLTAEEKAAWIAARESTYVPVPALSDPSALYFQVAPEFAHFRHRDWHQISSSRRFQTSWEISHPQYQEETYRDPKYYEKVIELSQRLYQFYDPDSHQYKNTTMHNISRMSPVKAALREGTFTQVLEAFRQDSQRTDPDLLLYVFRRMHRAYLDDSEGVHWQNYLRNWLLFGLVIRTILTESDLQLSAYFYPLLVEEKEPALIAGIVDFLARINFDFSTLVNVKMISGEEIVRGSRPLISVLLEYGQNGEYNYLLDTMSPEELRATIRGLPIGLVL